MLNKKLVLGSLAGASLLVGAAILVPSNVSALGLMQGTCVNCHTMHDSVAGTDQGVFGAQKQLLKWNGCVGCHSIGANANPGGYTGSVLNAEPYAPQVGTEASATQNGGGYFNTDASSHNVIEEGLTASATGDYDSDVTPGGSFPTSTGEEFNCIDCHGDAVGGHHTYTGQSNTRDGSANNSYRMLRADSVNDDTVDGAGVSALAPGTDTYVLPNRIGAEVDAFCADCHSVFHVTQGSQAAGWIRHPTGVSLASAAVGTYTDPETPAAQNTTIPTGDNAAGTLTGTDRLVMCVSCHAAHGATYADMLRFSYGASIAGNTATTGCENCHTAK
jgi:hypothetical protein